MFWYGRGSAPTDRGSGTPVDHRHAGRSRRWVADFQVLRWVRWYRHITLALPHFAFLAVGPMPGMAR